MVVSVVSDLLNLLEDCPGETLVWLMMKSSDRPQCPPVMDCPPSGQPADSEGSALPWRQCFGCNGGNEKMER